MRAGIVPFDIQGFQCSRLGLGKSVAWRSHAEEAQKSVNVPQTGVRLGVRRVSFDGLAQEFKTFLDALRSPPICIVHRFETQLVSLGGFGRPFRERLLLSKTEPNAQLACD